MHVQIYTYMYIHVVHIQAHVNMPLSPPLGAQSPDSASSGHLLHEGCHSAPQTAGQTDVPHQLHGDGKVSEGIFLSPFH